MKNTATHKKITSLVKQLKRRVLIVVGLIVFVLIFNLPVGIINASIQHSLDEQQIALQKDQNDLLLSMLNQQSDLRRYITSDSASYLEQFSSDRQQYLSTLHHLKGQSQGRNFSHTAPVLAQVEKRATTWYSTYAEVQIKNMQSGKLALASSTSTGIAGRSLFDQFRASVTQLQGVIEQDLNNRQARLDINSKIALISALLLSAIAIIILWYTFSRFVNVLRKQLNMLKTTASRLGSGDLSARVQELTYDELNSLGQTYNTMAEDLATRARDLERVNGEILQQRDELISLNSDLEEANRVRSQFLSTMSHELRTPLASIIGFSQLLLEDAATTSLSRQQHDNLGRILKNGQHLLSLVNDVLDLEKIEAGRIDVASTQIDVQELLTSVVEETQSIAIARNLTLKADIGEGVDFLESNPVKLRQILLNLVSNALKFTEQGEILVSAAQISSSDRKADSIAFVVKDTGIGISPETKKHIFEAFYQADGSYTRKSGGTGLGLSIVSQLTTLLGGKIEVKSTSGQGSTFTVILPLVPAYQQIEQNTPRLHKTRSLEIPNSTLAASSSVTADTPDSLDELFADPEPQIAPGEQSDLVLAVDDNPDVIVLMKAALQDTSYKVIGVQDPKKVMEMVQEMQPRAITLDVMMPDVNGWQILDQLKSNPATASIPVVMLTVLTEPTAGYVLGADDYLIKPFKSEALFNTLQRLVASQKVSSQAGQRATQPTYTHYK